MKLTEDEDDPIDLDEIPSEEMEVQVAHCLAGKLLTINTFNINAMKNVFRSAWKPQKELLIREVGKNLFIFQFFSMEVKETVIRMCLCSFDGHLLLIREIDGTEQPENLEFNYADFWVCLDNMPFKKRNLQGITSICNRVGEVLEVDETDVSRWSRSIRVRIRIEFNKALCRGRKIIIEGKPLWVYFKYEKLPNYCFFCGRLNHASKDCSEFDEDITEGDLPFGPW